MFNLYCGRTWLSTMLHARWYGSLWQTLWIPEWPANYGEGKGKYRGTVVHSLASIPGFGVYVPSLDWRSIHRRIRLSNKVGECIPCNWGGILIAGSSRRTLLMVMRLSWVNKRVMIMVLLVLLMIIITIITMTKIHYNDNKIHYNDNKFIIMITNSQ